MSLLPSGPQQPQAAEELLKIQEKKTRQGHSCHRARDWRTSCRPCSPARYRAALVVPVRSRQHPLPAFPSNPPHTVPQRPSIEMSPNGKALEKPNLSRSLNPAPENSRPSDLPTGWAGECLPCPATTHAWVMLHPTGSPMGGFSRTSESRRKRSISTEPPHCLTQAACMPTNRSLCTPVTSRRHKIPEPFYFAPEYLQLQHMLEGFLPLRAEPQGNSRKRRSLILKLTHGPTR